VKLGTWWGRFPPGATDNPVIPYNDSILMMAVSRVWLGVTQS
jgi:hypothetical protein